MKKVFFTWGILFGMPGIAIDIGTSFMAIANFVIFAVITCQGVRSIKYHKIYWNKQYILWYILLIAICITSVVSFFTLPDFWFYSAISRIFRIVIVIFALMFLFKKEQLLILRKNFIRGLYYSAVINMLWAWLQMYYGYIWGINLNSLVFRDILHLSAVVNWDQSVAHNIVYRMSGLSWEPATFGLIACVGYILSKNKILKALFIITILLSTSKSGIICLVLLFIRDLWHYIKTKKSYQYILNQNYIFF